MWQINEELNKILKEMWILDELVSNNKPLTDEQKEFYNCNLGAIKNYYTEKAEYWDIKKSL